MMQPWILSRPLNAWMPLLWGLALVGCTPTAVQLPPAPSPPTAASPATSPPTQASRIVALTSLSADILYRLDQTKLVGVPGSPLLRQNPDLAKLPQVSQGRTAPNLEKIVALKPDLVIGSKGFHEQTLEKLKSLGVQTLATEVNSWAELETLTRTLAATVQADPAPLLATYNGFLEAQPKQSASTLVLVSRQPLLAPNKRSWAGDLLNRFEAQNLAAEMQGNAPIQGYVTLSAEKILTANPEVLVLVDAPDGEIEKIKSESFWKQLKATQTNQVYTLSYYGFVNPGSIDAIEQACTQLKAIY
jgi:iron complex transport system substrate-binding protein